MNVPCVLAEEKTWDAGGDALDWFDDDNWFPTIAPTNSDDVVIDIASTFVTVSQTFEAKSLTLGGQFGGKLQQSNFVYGTLDPGSGSSQALINRAEGKITLKGSAGLLRLKGQYIDSEKPLKDEPSFIFLIK